MLRKIFLLALTVSLPLSLLQAQQPQKSPDAVFTRLPISFVQNQGQVDSQVRYLAQTGHGSIYFTPAETVLALGSRTTKDKPAMSVLRMKWIGANPNPQMLAEKPLPGKMNYLIGRDPSRWHTNLPTYARVRYRGLYPGVDAVFYGTEGQIEYDLVLSPGTSPQNISFAVDGMKSMQLDDSGDLVLRLASGEVSQLKPVVYQQVNGARRLLTAHYVIHGDKTVGFEVAGFDRKLPLVIDPTLAYSTFASAGSNFHLVNSIAVDQSGNAYVTGDTTVAFPNKHPEFGSQGSDNAYVTKFSPSGGSVIFSTVFGGSSSDAGNAIAVDRFGNTYIGGGTDSADFPTTPGSFEPPADSLDADNAFITKLNPSGTAFVYSVLLGGGDEDDILALALDTQHRVYVTGFTCSTNFFVKNAFKGVSAQNCADGGGDAFVTRLNAAGTDVDYSTYLDGSIESFGHGIAVDSTFHAYVTGSTESPDFPVTPGAFQTTLKAQPIPNFPNDILQSNAFATKFSANGQSLVFSTFLGGTANDVAQAIALDPDGRACVTGNATSKDFPITSGAFQKTLRGPSDVFVTKFQLSGGGLFYSTFLGGSSDDGASSIAVDSLGRAYVTGSTSSTNFPVLHPIQAHLAGGGGDAFVAKLSATGNALFFSTYLGGTSDDVGESIRLDSAGNAYIGGATGSTDFPTTPGAFSRTDKPGFDGWVAKITP